MPTDLNDLASRVADLSEGQWAVFCSRSYGVYRHHEAGVIHAVKPRTVLATVGHSIRVRRFDRDNVIPAETEEHAKLLVARLDSAKGEAIRREREAQAFYKRTIGKIYNDACAQGPET